MKGFTLVELLVAIGIATILLGLTTINLVKVQNSTSLGTVTDTLIADFKAQQMKTMSGSSGGGSFGIHFTSSNSYILFKAPYSALDPTNFTITLDQPITVYSSFPSNEVIFTPITGETGALNTITIQNSAGPKQQTITVNELGTITDVN